MWLPKLAPEPSLAPILSTSRHFLPALVSGILRPFPPCVLRFEFLLKHGYPSEAISECLRRPPADAIAGSLGRTAAAGALAQSEHRHRPAGGRHISRKWADPMCVLTFHAGFRAEKRSNNRDSAIASRSTRSPLASSMPIDALKKQLRTYLQENFIISSMQTQCLCL